MREKTYTIVEGRESKTERMVVIHFGALADSIEKQLIQQSITRFENQTIDHFQLDAEAIVRLSVRGLLPDSQRRQLNEKLMARIVAHLKGMVK